MWDVVLAIIIFVIMGGLGILCRMSVNQSDIEKIEKEILEEEDSA